MIRLISKVQYKNFEAGEFVHVQQRNCNETIGLIEKFPWDNQRDKIVIDLTNPSITIEGKNNDFLKVALFFNSKYVFYYFDDSQTLFTKSFTNLKDGFTYIKNYFEQSKFDPVDFKKETTWFKHNTKHFLTQDFRYLLTPKSITNYLLSTSGINFLFSIAMLVLLLLRWDSISFAGLLAISLAMFLIGGGLHLILFFSYYKHLKNKILIMSKCNDTFYFGDVDTPLKYDKKDLLQYTTIRSSGSRNQFSGFAIVKIAFKNGTVLQIPNLLADHSAIEDKLFEYKRIDVNKLPLLN